MVIIFTDLVDSSALKVRLGDQDYVQHIARPHNQIFRELLRQFPGAAERAYTGDGFMATFASVADAVMCALEFHEALRRHQWERVKPETRVGIHLGDTIEFDGKDSQETALASHAADMTARVMSLAEGGQILMTRAAFDSARQSVRALAPERGELEWLAYGHYRFKGKDEPMEVFEVGIKGISPLQPPGDSEKARRAVTDEEAATLGWRPAVDLAIPSRPGWKVAQKLGEGGFGEVWLGRQERTEEVRAFKFCFDPDRLRAFKRELTFFKLIRKGLGDRDDIARLLEVQVDHPPFYLESEFIPGGNLKDWADRRGGINQVPLKVRLEFAATIARAVAAAHSLAIIHKDLKPSNVLIAESADGKLHPRIADFGIGVLADSTLLEREGLKGTGLSETLLVGNDSSRTGTRMYSPPEALTDESPTTGWDIYSLGIILYQLVIGDLNRPLGVGWERDVTDELLRADIAGAVDVQPSRRFSSATELADRIEKLEIRRAAAQKEAEARARLAEAEARAIRRKRALAAAVTITLLALGASLVSFVFYRRAVSSAASEREARTQAEISATAERVARAQAENSAAAERAARTQAENNFQLAKASLDSLIVDLSEGELAKRPELETVQLDLLRRVMAHYQQLAVQKASDSSVLLGYARGLTRLGIAERAAGTAEGANTAFTNALTFHAKLPPADADTTEARLARLETAMEFLRRAEPFPDELAQKTIAELDNVIASAEKAPAANTDATHVPAADQARYLKARCLNILATRESEEKAIEDCSRAYDLMTTLASRWPSNTMVTYWTAIIESNLGNKLRRGGEITQPAALAVKLREGRDVVSKYLWEQFTANSRELLTATNTPGSRVRYVLEEEIGRLYLDKSFYNPDRFRNVALSTNTLKLTENYDPDADPWKLNRALLRDTYPTETGGALKSVGKLEEAVQRLEELWSRDPEATERDQALSSAYYNLGLARLDSGDRLNALNAFDGAARVATKFADRHPTVMEFRRNQAGMLRDASYHRVGDIPASDRLQAPTEFAAALDLRQKEADARDALVRADPSDIYNVGAALTVHIYIARWSPDYLGTERLRHWREATRLAQKLDGLGDAATNQSVAVLEFQQEQASTLARAKDFAGLAETLRRACTNYDRCISIGNSTLAIADEYPLTQVFRRAQALPGDPATERELERYAREWPNKKVPARILWQLQLLQAQLLRNRGEVAGARALLAEIRASARDRRLQEPSDIGAAAILADSLGAAADLEASRTNLDGEIEARSELARTLAGLSQQKPPASRDLTVLRNFCETNRIIPFHLFCEKKEIAFNWEFVLQAGAKHTTNWNYSRAEALAASARRGVLARSLLEPQIAAARAIGITLRSDAQTTADYLTNTNASTSIEEVAPLLSLSDEEDQDAELLDAGNQVAELRARLENEPSSFSVLRQLPDRYLDAGRALVRKSAPDASRAAAQALSSAADAMQNGAADGEKLNGWIQQTQFLLDTIEATNRIPAVAFEKKSSIVLIKGKGTNGKQIYAYVRVQYAQETILDDALKAGNSEVIPSDYGEVLASGDGEPSPEVVAEMRKKYPEANEGQLLDPNGLAVPAPPPPRDLKADLEKVTLSRSKYAVAPDDLAAPGMGSQKDWARLDLAEKLTDAAYAALFEKRFADAEKWSEEAIQLESQISPDFPGRVRKNLVALIQNTYGHTLLFQGRYDKALAAYRKLWAQEIDGQKLYNVTTDDFDELEAAGLKNPDIARVKRVIDAEVKKSDSK